MLSTYNIVTIVSFITINWIVIIYIHTQTHTHTDTHTNIHNIHCAQFLDKSGSPILTNITSDFQWSPKIIVLYYVINNLNHCMFVCVSVLHPLLRMSFISCNST